MTAAEGHNWERLRPWRGVQGHECGGGGLGAPPAFSHALIGSFMHPPQQSLNPLCPGAMPGTRLRMGASATLATGSPRAWGA